MSGEITAMVHALTFPLGAKFRVPHGHSNARVMGPGFRAYDEAVGIYRRRCGQAATANRNARRAGFDWPRPQF